MKKKKKNNQGITLVALVVTIVVLLILAAITITYVFGENSVFKQAVKAKEETEIAKARETLETVLVGDASTEKHTNSQYDQDAFLDKIILDNIKEAIISGNIVIVDGYGFEIDRGTPKIINDLGKIKIDEAIKITTTVTPSLDYVKATITITVEYEGEITEITFKGETITLPAKQEGKYTFTVEVIENGNYSVIAKGEKVAEGAIQKCNIKNVIVTEITEDMDIHNVEEMKMFRDKVNEGRTFEGKTIRLLADIDLKGSETNKWTPIGSTGIEFKGTFEGNKKTISNIYIDEETKNDVGFFSKNCGSIRNMKLEGSVRGGVKVGGAARYV